MKLSRRSFVALATALTATPQRSIANASGVLMGATGGALAAQEVLGAAVEHRVAVEAASFDGLSPAFIYQEHRLLATFQDIHTYLEREMYQTHQYVTSGNLPPDIAAKKAWSAVYKHAVLMQRVREITAMVRTLSHLLNHRPTTPAARLARFAKLNKLRKILNVALPDEELFRRRHEAYLQSYHIGLSPLSPSSL